MVDAIQSALQGLNTQSTRIEQAARDIATGPVRAQQAREFTGSTLVETQPAPSLEESIVSIIEASALYRANAAVIRTVSDIEDSLLDVLS